MHELDKLYRQIQNDNPHCHFCLASKPNHKPDCTFISKPVVKIDDNYYGTYMFADYPYYLSHLSSTRGAVLAKLEKLKKSGIKRGWF